MIANAGAAIDQLVPVNSSQAAEMTKLLENFQGVVNIGPVDELRVVADRMGIGMFEAIEAAASARPKLPSEMLTAACQCAGGVCD